MKIPDPVVRCLLYKALTRAHVGVFIINKMIKDGLLEWLMGLRMIITIRNIIRIYELQYIK